jgi:hypothetical protein
MRTFSKKYITYYCLFKSNGQVFSYFAPLNLPDGAF